MQTVSWPLQSQWVVACLLRLGAPGTPSIKPTARVMSFLSVQRTIDLPYIRPGESIYSRDVQEWQGRKYARLVDDLSISDQQSTRHFKIPSTSPRLKVPKIRNVSRWGDNRRQAPKAALNI